MNLQRAQDILNHARRIAIVRTDRLGDMVLTLPLARALKERFPEVSIEMIARRYTAPLLDNSPVLDAVHFVDQLPLGKLFKDQFYDAVFFPRPVFRECLEAFAARIPIRVGSAYRWYSPLFNCKVYDHRKTAERHEAEYNVRMLGNILGEQITAMLVAPVVDVQARVKVDQLLCEKGILKDEQFIVVHPATGGSAFEWSAAKFGEAANIISREQQLRVVITGTANESAKCSEAFSHCRQAINLCGQLELSDMIALLERASLLVANSTGVLHIAAALGTSVVGLYPNTPHISAKRWGPYSQNSRVISPPRLDSSIFNDDMNMIEVESVVEAVKTLFSR